MANNASNKKSPASITGLVVIVCLALAVWRFMAGTGEPSGGDSSAMLGATLAVTLLAGIASVSLFKRKASDVQTVEAQRNELNALTDRYNRQIDEKRRQFQASQALGRQTTSTSTRDNYEWYKNLLTAYNKERNALKSKWAAKGTPRLKSIWQALMGTGFAAIFFNGCYQAGNSLSSDDSAQVSSLMEHREWSIDNLPMPHMQDHSLYLCNPDSIVSTVTEDSINAVLGRLDDELGIESVMAIVGHIEGDDPVALVRDIYDKYKVGRGDRGLVIVVGYLDHSYFIAPGRSLEGDLTDAECNRLAHSYLIPSMKAEQPDSGMLYLAQGVYALMLNKEAPVMSSLSSSSKSEDESLPVGIAYLGLLLGWGWFSRSMSRKISPTVGATPLKGYPFSSDGGFSGGGFGGFSGGGRSSGGFSGGHSSGGFGGGSWGGGGAGGRW